jgi:transcriptional regulator with XRE-family HTH domain
MMNKANNSILTLSDNAILAMIGNFLKEQRIQQNKTQEEIAQSAGIDRTTLLKMENGSASNMLSFIQVLRALGQLELLQNFEFKEQISPLLLAKMQQYKRKRASKKI